MSFTQVVLKKKKKQLRNLTALQNDWIKKDNLSEHVNDGSERESYL